MKRVIVAVGVLLSMISAGYSQTAQTELDGLMTKQQQQSMGIQKLNAAEKQRLLEYLLHVFSLGVETGQGGGGAVPPNQLSGTAPSGSTYYGVGSGHWLQEKMGGGERLILEDGSIWDVDAYDLYNTLLWLPISDITVLESSSCPGRGKYLLVNTDDGEKACAKFIGGR